ncbi:MAG TPA: tRNA pseudouridine(38-40) synthase TruA [Candidatus Thermoplasmatota archaeon]|nr:tRNA pseudouridine(38-40) synthase TruA [Candidatus Thermoplasmatota archaeon]
MTLRHVALRIAYDGSCFDAYARNPELRTVEGSLIGALRKEGYVEDSFRTGSRTDAGVSALENVCKATIDRDTMRGLVPALQRHCPEGLWVTAAAEVVERWNPRHARRRRYRYDAISRGEDLAAMQDACEAFIGRNDMRAFARMEEGRKPERTVFAFTVEAQAGGWSFVVEGDGFLWNQVRRMCGAVLAVGRGDAKRKDIEASLASGRSYPKFRLAAPDGLLLERIEYDQLEWDAEGGRLGQQVWPRSWQAARARSLLMDHLAGLAPWTTPATADPQQGLHE